MDHSKCAKYMLWTLSTGFISITYIMWLRMSTQLRLFKPQALIQEGLQECLCRSVYVLYLDVQFLFWYILAF